MKNILGSAVGALQEQLNGIDNLGDSWVAAREQVDRWIAMISRGIPTRHQLLDLVEKMAGPHLDSEEVKSMFREEAMRRQWAKSKKAYSASF